MKIMKIKFLRHTTMETYLQQVWESWGTLGNKSNVKFICQKDEELDSIFLIKNIDEPISYFLQEGYVLIIPNDSFEVVQEYTLEEYKEIVENALEGANS